MVKFTKYFYWLYALILVVLVGLALYTLFGGFAHDYIDPAM